jgi:hypothetical protein
MRELGTMPRAPSLRYCGIKKRMMNKGNLGGIATARKLRQLALDSYYLNPNRCMHCGSIIVVTETTKVTAVRVKKFCDSSCAAKYNNHKYPKRKSSAAVPTSIILNCQSCGNQIISGDLRRKYCKACRYYSRRVAFNSLGKRTKGSLFSSSANWQSARSSLRSHACKVFARSKRPKECVVCRYSIHVNIAHLCPVSAFPETALISEINHISNLVALCPNHHWEFDHSFLKIEDLIKLH